MSGELILLLVASIIVFTVDLAVGVAHNITRLVKFLFAGICFALIFWQVTIYITANIQEDLILWNHLVFVGPTLALASAFFFIVLANQPAPRVLHSKALRPWLGVVGAAVFLQLVAILSGRIFTEVNYDVITEAYSYSRGMAYVVYIVGLLVLIAAVIAKLVQDFRRSKPHSRDRLALKVFLITVIIASVYGIITNVVLPLITKSDTLLSLGLLAMDIFALGLALGIIRYRFLDIRVYVFRSAVYILTFSATVVLYLGAASLIASQLLHAPLNAAELGMLSLVTLAIAVSFQTLRRYFDNLTSRLFFRDYYDPQTVLDRIGKVLVGTVDLDEIRDKSAEIIESALHPVFVRYLLVSDSRGIDAKLLQELLDSGMTIVAIDELDKRQFPGLYSRLAREEIGLATRLSTTHDDLGFILIGERKSGNAYSINDKRLTRTLADTLAIGLQNALRFEEIENFNFTLQQKVEDATRKLRRTNEKLRRLDEIKDDFISMASHQLRTPLTSVKGYVSMVLDGDAGRLTPLQRKLLNQSFVSSQRMAYLISDLLNVSRLRTGKFIIDAAPTNLAKVIQDEVDQLQETVKGRNLTLNYTHSDRFPTLMVDETKMRQVIMNFIDNAIYYTPSGGHIEVTLSETPKTIQLTVTDNGIGVPRPEQHHLFTKFFRARNAKHARPDGTGLGLFMAKKVIIAQGGAVIFKSQQGKGSTFGFTFPKEALEVPKTKPAVAPPSPQMSQPAAKH